MKDFIRKADGFFQKVLKVEEFVATILQIFMLVLCFLAVVKRYVFNSPWVWTDEIQLMVLVFFGYLAISIDVYKDNHVALEGFYKKLNRKGKLVLDLFRHTIIGIFCLLMTRYAWVVWRIKARKKLPITRLSQGNVFIAQLICGALMVIFCVFNILRTISAYYNNDNET